MKLYQDSGEGGRGTGPYGSLSEFSAYSYVLLASQFQFSTALLLLLFCFCCCCSEIGSPVAQAGLGLMSLLLLSFSARITGDG